MQPRSHGFVIREAVARACSQWHACDASVLLDDDRRRAMAEAARTLGRPGAAQALADELIAMAEGRPLPSDAA